MAITFSSQDIDFELPQPETVKKWISEVVTRQNRRLGNVNYLFCDDEHILQVNREFLNHDTYTDIITFDYVRCNVISGDILISVERVRDNAATLQVPFIQELHRVVIHGILHLLGQGDKSEVEAAQMRQKEEQALALFPAL